MSRNNFLHSLHWFRGIAVIFVVMSHIPVPKVENFFVTFLNIIFANGTFFFVFVSGYLFWHLIDRYEYKKYLQNRLLFVILPYVIITSLTMLFITLLEFYQIDQIKFEGVIINFSQPFEAFSGVVWHFMVGRSILIPLWFIPFITLVFLFSFVFFKVAKTKYFIYIMLFFVAISLFTFRPVVENTSYLFPVYMFGHFIGVFMFGIFLKQHQDFVYQNSYLLMVILGLGYIMVTIYAVITHSLIIEFNKIVNIEQIKMFFGVVFFLSALFLIENKIIDKGIHNQSLQKFLLTPLAILATYSLGIFFIHALVIKLVRRAHHVFWGEIASITSYIMLGVSTILISLIIIVIIHKVLGHRSKYVVGC